MHKFFLIDYLIEPPKFYPKGIQRPNLGCRTLVKRNVSKIIGAIARELLSWQEDVRVRCSQLLCAIALHAEEGITHNLQDLLLAMYSAARDDDQRVVCNIVQASEIIGKYILQTTQLCCPKFNKTTSILVFAGCFVKFETWSDLLLPLLNDGPHFGHLTVLNGLVTGSPKEYIGTHIEEISKTLAEDSVCCSRKVSSC